jgi:hypothetical protein
MLDEPSQDPRTGGTDRAAARLRTRNFDPKTLMKRKRARFDVVSIEITVHCPHCDRPTESPARAMFTWNAADIRHKFGRDINCLGCGRRFQLPNSLRNLLMSSSDPVSTDLRVSIVAQVEIICPNCCGDAQEPRTTLLTTNGRCASCGCANVVPANQKLQPEAGEVRRQFLERLNGGQ